MSEELDNSVDGELNEEEFDIEEDRLIMFGGLTQSGFMNFGVTIWVHGQMITGTMVDRVTYLEIVARKLKDATGSHADIFANAVGDAARREREVFDAETDKLNGVMGEFIYLIDVSILGPNGWSELGDVPWKGRISSVDGFIYGTMN